MATPYRRKPAEPEVPFEPVPQRSTFWTRTKATLKYNRLTKFYLTMTRPRFDAANILELKLTKFHYHALFACTLIGNHMIITIKN